MVLRPRSARSQTLGTSHSPKIFIDPSNCNILYTHVKFWKMEGEYK